MNRIVPVNKIIPFSNVDGPSNRMAIFFQGCQFNCLFCHNPETINLCINCGECVNTCPTKALTLQNNKVIWDKEKCVSCDTCLKTCKHNSSPRITYMNVDELLKEIEKVRPYIEGITLSGGECTIHKDFIIELLPKVKQLGLSTLIDSNGSLDFEENKEILEYCDGVMLDVKAVNKQYSDWLIRYPNEVVLKNLNYLLNINKLYEVRTIIFPNRDKDNEETITYVSNMIKDKCLYKIIRYRQFGVRQEGIKELGDETTDEDYALHYVQLAKALGASKAFLV